MAAGAEALDRADPGHAKLARLDENLAAADISLSAEELDEIETALASIEVQGARGTGREVYL